MILIRSKRDAELEVFCLRYCVTLSCSIQELREFEKPHFINHPSPALLALSVAAVRPDGPRSELSGTGSMHWSFRQRFLPACLIRGVFLQFNTIAFKFRSWDAVKLSSYLRKYVLLHPSFWILYAIHVLPACLY